MFDVYILNLQKAEKRRYLTEGALFAMETSFKRVKLWKAIDDQDYGKTREVCEAAIADGFPDFQQYLDEGQHNESGIAFFTQFWNHCRFWRHVVELGEMTMFMHDDRRMRVPYPKLVSIVEDVLEFDPNFQFMSLWCRHYVIKKEKFPIRWIVEDSPVAHTLLELGGDVGHVVTPEGAQRLLDNIIGYFPPRIDYAVYARCHTEEHFYTLADEHINLEHLVLDNHNYIQSQIFDSTSREFLRRVHMTADDHSLARNPK